jgi:hypothetical protein
MPDMIIEIFIDASSYSARLAKPFFLATAAACAKLFAEQKKAEEIRTNQERRGSFALRRLPPGRWSNPWPTFFNNDPK